MMKRTSEEDVSSLNSADVSLFFVKRMKMVTSAEGDGDGPW
jgi:hypothetical protein